MLKVNRAAWTSDSQGFRRMFAPGRLTLGRFFPIEAFPREPMMRDQERLAGRAGRDGRPRAEAGRVLEEIGRVVLPRFEATQPSTKAAE
jgi:hypothetical protein